MANVFIARRVGDGAAVVVKIPKAHLIRGDETFAKRFTREIQILLTFDHPNIVPVFDVGETDGLPFVVMPYLGGGSLRDRARPGFPGAPGAVRGWLMPIAEALDDTHARQLYHRDVKPDNILFDNSGRVYLTDFGIVKPTAGNMTNLTSAGGVLGTAWYMAPESIEGKPIDHRADQFAFAATVYELLAGQVPFAGDTAAVIYVNQLRKRPVPLDAPGMPWSAALSEAVVKGLALRPNGRYLNCREFAAAVLSKLPPPAADRPPEPPAQSQRGPITTTVNALADTKSGDRSDQAIPALAVPAPVPQAKALPKPTPAAPPVPAQKIAPARPVVLLPAPGANRVVLDDVEPVAARATPKAVPIVRSNPRAKPPSGVILDDVDAEEKVGRNPRWYLRTAGKVSGPYDQDEVLDFLRSGQIRAHTEASRDRRKWKAVEFIEAFRGHFRVPRRSSGSRRRKRLALWIGAAILAAIAVAAGVYSSGIGRGITAVIDSSTPTTNRGRP